MRNDNNSNFGCLGNTIRLRSGKYLDLALPTIQQFTLQDIACGLSRMCRFAGQIDQFYSVAQHSVNCWLLSVHYRESVQVQRAVLMHDAAEAFIGDMAKPLKIMMPSYVEVEQRLEKVIGEKFHIDFEQHKETIKRFDRMMLIHERNSYFSSDGKEWTGERETERVPDGLTLSMKHYDSRSSELLFSFAASQLEIFPKVYV